MHGELERANMDIARGLFCKTETLSLPANLSRVARYTRVLALTLSLVTAMLSASTAFAIEVPKASSPDKMPDLSKPAPPRNPQVEKAMVLRLWQKNHQLAQQAFAAGKYQAALQAYGEAIESANVLHFAEPILIKSLDGVAETYEAVGQPEEAIKAVNKALECRQAARTGDGEIGTTLVTLGRLQNTMGRADEAWSTLERARAIVDRPGANPDAVRTVLGELAKIMVARKDIQVAEGYLRRLQSLDAKVAPDERTASHLELLAQIRSKNGNLLTVENLLSRSLAIRQAKSGENDPIVQAIKRNLVRIKIYLGQTQEAQLALNKVLDFDRSKLLITHPDYAFDLTSLAMLKASRGEMTAAKAFADQAIEMQRQALGENHVDMADAYSTLALVALANKEYQSAEGIARQALKIRDGAKLHEVFSASDLGVVGEALLARGEKDSAAALLTKAHELQSAILPPTSHRLIALRKSLSSALAQVGQKEQSDQILSEVTKVEGPTEETSTAKMQVGEKSASAVR